MAHTGCIDWRKLARSNVFHDTREGSTYVYAFWLADYPPPDSALAVLRPSSAHPDWFCAGPGVDRLITVALGSGPAAVASPSIVEIFDDTLASKPMLASVCLGSASATYAFPDRTAYWWASDQCLTRSGRRLMKNISKLYLRKPVLVTYLDLAPIGLRNPGAARGTATVAEAPGH